MGKTTVSVAVLLMALGAISYGGGTPKSEARTLFEMKCSSCHGKGRTMCEMKSAQGWESTVVRMKEINGAPISDEEAKLITGYLEMNYCNSTCRAYGNGPGSGPQVPGTERQQDPAR